MKSPHIHLTLFLALLFMISLSSCQQDPEDKNDTETVEEEPLESPCLPPIESKITDEILTTWENNQDSLFDSSSDQFGVWPDYFQVDMSAFISQVDTTLHSHFRIYYGMVCSDQNTTVVLLSTYLPIECNSILHESEDSLLVILPHGVSASSCGLTDSTTKVSYTDAITWTNSWRTFNQVSEDQETRTVNGTTYKVPLAFNFNCHKFYAVLNTDQPTLEIDAGLMKIDTVDYSFYEYKLILNDEQVSGTDYLDFASPCPRHCGNYSDPLLTGEEQE